MANSPGPSSSNVTHNQKGEDGGPKKKKTRRKPRTRPPKAMPEPAGGSSPNNSLVNRNSPISYNFAIRSVKEVSATVYRRRNPATGHIHLNSFAKNCQIPCLFATKSAYEPKNTANLLNRIRQMSINGVQKTPPKMPEKKKPIKKDHRLFPEHMSKEEVDRGLQSGQLMKGYIRLNPKNTNEAYVGHEDNTKVDYVISSVRDRNRALDGDEVILKPKTANNDKRRAVEVVYIYKKVHPRVAVGVLKPLEKNKEYALFTPRDKRIPKMKIPKICWPSGFQLQPELFESILLVAKISDWREVYYALGSITENLGLSGELQVESLAILREFCLDPTPYGDNIKRFLPKSAVIPKAEFEYRTDLRKECIFTIDPITARDLDDAVSCKPLPNGNYEVGVHISDAAFYLKENTKLDEMVRSKATTIYMVDSVYHMLPIELCMLCSLLPGQDKLAFSVFWEMTADGVICHERFARTIINSCAQLAYEHAQMMIEQPQRQFSPDELPTIHHGFTAADLSETVNNLQRIAVKLSEKRKQNGALRIDQVKISFSLDPATGQPLKFWVYENKAAHRLIEEFMLLANMTVAKRILHAFPDIAFLRMHEPPKPTMMNELQRNLETVGMHFDIASSGGIQSSLNKYLGVDFLAQCRMAVLNHLFAKPMTRARYFCPGTLEEDVAYDHFALSVPLYTHFTSPIRRYADIMVHRLLAAALKYCEKPKWSPEEVGEVAEICNRQKYQAKKAGEASSDLYLAHYIEDHQPYIQDAVVVDVKENSVDAIVLNTGSVVRVYTNNFGENVSSVSEEVKCDFIDDDSCNMKKIWRIVVTFPKTDSEPQMEYVLEIFSVVRVALTRKPKTNQLEAKLLRPVPPLCLL